ncbi:hypothetical protein FC696_10070 [Bacillus wiedmannii]|uniref:hypothetical protein n=1 Tax=Bacillus TaxID=1386 RepID=UPI0010BE2E5D|nr:MULTISPECIES: hypothetical protein [Bacillus]TKI13699.1 hypothetical protein FC696_10070 [Bacillus wiedmannii]
METKSIFNKVRMVGILAILIALGTNLNVFKLPENQEFLLRTISFTVAVISAIICIYLNRKIKKEGQ